MTAKEVWTKLLSAMKIGAAKGTVNAAYTTIARQHRWTSYTVETTETQVIITKVSDV